MSPADRWPTLYHVTDRASVPLIERFGLLSAARLCGLFEVPATLQRRLLAENRKSFETIKHPTHGQATLRRQLLPDGPLSTRLAPDLSAADWRRFLNAHVFLWPGNGDARKFSGCERHRDQVILAWSTNALIGNGLALLGCQFNNGSIDRKPAGLRRARCYADYQPLASVTCLREVAIRDGIPPDIAFTVSA